MSFNIFSSFASRSNAPSESSKTSKSSKPSKFKQLKTKLRLSVSSKPELSSENTGTTETQEFVKISGRRLGMGECLTTQNPSLRNGSSRKSNVLKRIKMNPFIPKSKAIRKPSLDDGSSRIDSAHELKPKKSKMKTLQSNVRNDERRKPQFELNAAEIESDKEEDLGSDFSTLTTMAARDSHENLVNSRAVAQEVTITNNKIGRTEPHEAELFSIGHDTLRGLTKLKRSSAIRRPRTRTTLPRATENSKSDTITTVKKADAKVSNDENVLKSHTPPEAIQKSPSTMSIPALTVTTPEGKTFRISLFTENFDLEPLTPQSTDSELDPLADHQFLAAAVEYQHQSS